MAAGAPRAKCPRCGKRRRLTEACWHCLIQLCGICGDDRYGCGSPEARRIARESEATDFAGRRKIAAEIAKGWKRN